MKSSEEPKPGKKRRKGRMAGGAGWVVSKTVAPPVWPAKTTMQLRECTDDVLEVWTRNRLWWPGPCWLAALVGAVIHFRSELMAELERGAPYACGPLAVVAGLATLIVALTAFLSTHERLRVAAEGVDYQVRLAWRLLKRRQAPLGEITQVVDDDYASDAIDSSYLLLITQRWEARFGAERSNEAIAFLIWKICRLQAKFVVTTPPPLPTGDAAGPALI